MSAEVFISYASEDRERILDLVERLRGAGVSVWIDQMGIEGATMWSQEIVEAIDGCKVLILAISQRSTESENVVKELALASERRKKILPVCLDSSGIPKSMEYQLAGIQRVEYVKGKEDQGILAMIRSLGKLGVIVSDEASEQAAKAPGIISPGPSHQRGFNTTKREIVPWLKITAGLTGLVLLAIGIFFLVSSGKKTPEQNLPLAKPQTLDTNRVVVLPFKTIGTSGETADLGYGLVSTLTSKLQPLQNLTIIANESALQFEGSKLPPKKIGESLQVGTIVTGEIQTSDEKIQVNIRVIDANTEALVWGSTFSKTKNEFLDLQNVIATQLATKLKGSLNEDETKQLALKATENVEAQAAYQSGRREWNKRSEEGFLNSIKHFNKAIELDPNYADPHSGLSDAYSLMIFYKHASRDEVIHLVKINAKLAMEKNPKLAKAYVSMAGLLYNYEYNWIDGEKYFKRAIELNPNYATGMQWYASLLRNKGELDDSLNKLIRAERSDPSSMIIKCDLAYTYFELGNNKEALIYADKALSIEPNFRRALRLKYVELLSEGTSKAIERFNILLNTNENITEDRLSLFDLYLKDDNKLMALEQLSLITGDLKTSRENCALISMMYYKINNISYSYDWLHQAFLNQETGEIFWDLITNNKYKRLHSKDKFKILMKSINHPSYVDK